MSLNENAVRAALAKFPDPDTGRSIAQLHQIERLEVAGERISVALGLTTWSAPIWDDVRGEVESLLFAVQAALGAGFLGYVIGRRQTSRRDDVAGR